MTNKKFALVTGASTGIGRAIAVVLARNKISVGLVARSKDDLEQTKKLIEKENGEAEIYVADLASINSINSLLRVVEQKHSKINILINVAGIWHGKNEVYAGKDFEKFSQKVIIDTYIVGSVAPTLLSHACISRMPENSKVINISGTFESGAKGWLPYFVSKRAIEDLTIGLAQELKRKNIQVNCISPSDTATEAYAKYFPQYIHNAVKPEEIARFALYLCSDKAKNVTGKVFVVKKDKAPYEGYHA